MMLAKFTFIGMQNVAYKEHRWCLSIVQVLFCQPVMENENTMNENTMQSSRSGKHSCPMDAEGTGPH